MSPRSAIAALAVTAALAVPSAAAQRTDTSERYAYSTFRAQTGAIDVLVDGYPASLHPEDAYIPIPVAIAKVSAGKAIALTPESFRLIDAQGNAVPAAAYGELLRNYGKMSFDRSMLHRRPLTLGAYYGSYLDVRGAFFPPPEDGSRIQRVEVPAYGIYRDVLYFPMPPAGLSGVLTLEMKVPDAPPVRVKFVASAEGLAALTAKPQVTLQHGA